MKLELKQATRIKTGKPNVFSCETEAYKTIIMSSPEKVCVTISPVRKKRSTGPWSANHHLNGHVQQIASHTGNTFEDVKLYVKRQAFSRGLPFMTRADKSIVLSLVDGQPLPISEADMDSVQCGWCIEECHILASEYGVELVEE